MGNSRYDEHPRLELGERPALPVVAKRLSRVEVNPNASHQREFHAGSLRRALRFDGGEDTSGTLLIAIYEADGSDPLIEQASYKLYDARRASSSRSAEWRLYPGTDLFQRRAHEGDLMVVIKPDPGATLSVLIARAGTTAERLLSDALRAGDSAVLRHFKALVPRPLSEREATQLAFELTTKPVTHALPPADSTLRKRYVEEALAHSDIPPSAELATKTHEILRAEYGTSQTADDFLSAAIEIESSLFFAIEERVGAARVAAAMARGGGFSDIMRLSQSMLQSRKSRMGQSLQNHVAAVLRNADIPFTSQCPTERGATPDFVIPGWDAYHDRDYPADLLRMVGCKSRVRERWRQYESEADRIAIKHHVSLDDGISAEVLEQMHRASLRLHMPERLIAARYGPARRAGFVNTISALVSELSGVAYTARARGLSS